MAKILICICSKDIKKLKITLDSLIELKLNNKDIIEFIIVDNSKNLKIKNYCKNINLINKVKINYFHFIKKGIPNLRNKCLKESKKIKSNYISFVDDDSIIPKDWLLNHLKIFKMFNNCSIVSGPQNSSKKNLYYNLLNPNFKNLSIINWCPTNNVMFKSKILNKTNLVFDNRLTNIGGSDQLFFSLLKINGFEIRWNSNNPVIETYQKKRDNLNWFIKRNFRYSSSSVLIDRYTHGFTKGTFYSVLRFNFYVLKFLINILIIPINPKKNFLICLNYLIRCISIILGFFGFFPKKYI